MGQIVRTFKVIGLINFEEIFRTDLTTTISTDRMYPTEWENRNYWHRQVCEKLLETYPWLRDDFSRLYIDGYPASRHMLHQELYETRDGNFYLHGKKVKF